MDFENWNYFRMWSGVTDKVVYIVTPCDGEDIEQIVEECDAICDGNQESDWWAEFEDAMFANDFDYDIIWFNDVEIKEW